MEINEVEDSFIINPADTDVFNTSSGRLKKVTTSYDQTSCHDVWKRRWIYDVLKTSDLRHSEDVHFTMSWRRPICDVLKTSDLIHFEDFWSVTSWKCLQNCSNVVATSKQHRKKMLFVLILHCLNYSQFRLIFSYAFLCKSTSLMKELNTLNKMFYRIRREERELFLTVT